VGNTPEKGETKQSIERKEPNEELSRKEIELEKVKLKQWSLNEE
jgi:hypothetical protein